MFGKKHTDDQEEYPQYGDNFIPIIPSDYSVHTADNPFCDDMSCPCHEDQSATYDLNGYYSDGLVSRDDADRIYRGKTF